MKNPYMSMFLSQANRAAGYAREPRLRLNLVHNPVGAFLPGSQASLERDMRLVNWSML